MDLLSPRCALARIKMELLQAAAAAIRGSQVRELWHFQFNFYRSAQNETHTYTYKTTLTFDA